MYADTIASSTPTINALKIIVGLAVVLVFMAFIAWALRRLVPLGYSQKSVVKIIGGVSVGSRERVIVIEVANRWIVVGVSPGSVNAIANIEAGTIDSNENPSLGSFKSHAFVNWLNKSLDKSGGSKEL